MIFHLTAFLFTLGFFFFLRWITGTSIEPSWSFYLSTTVPLIILSIVAARQLSNRLVAAYLPSVVAFSTPLLLSLIDSGIQQEIFIWGASVLYYFALLSIYRLNSAPEDQTARAMQNMVALGSLLFGYAGSYGLYLNFEIPLWLLMLVFFFATFLVSFQTLLSVVSGRRRMALLASLVLGIVFAELVWLLHFWPFGYLTTGMVTLLLFYWLWRVAFDVLRKQFSQKQFLVESLLLLALLVLLLATSPWRMVV